MIDEKIKQNEINMIILPNDTENIIEYTNENLNEKNNDYKFWNLLKKN